MTRVTLESALSERLQTLHGMVELCDPTGKVLGRFFPEQDLSAWEAATPEPTEEELAEAELALQQFSKKKGLKPLRS